MTPSNKKTALITGITGQDGAYLAHLLLKKGYAVHGIKRRSSSFNTQRIDPLYLDEHLPSSQLKLHYGDLTDPVGLARVVEEVAPDEIYNLAAQSHVRVSFDQPDYTGQVDGLGTVRLLECVRSLGLTHKTRFYQASTSELYGKVRFSAIRNHPLPPSQSLCMCKNLFLLERGQLPRGIRNVCVQRDSL